MNTTEKLVEACQFGDVDSAKEAVRDGADVNIGDGDYMPIHWAAQEGHMDIVGILLDSGADINSQDKHGFTPLQKAVGENHPELVRYLFQRGADIDDRCNGQGTPLHTACAYGLLECASILLAAGADTEIKDDNGKLPIEYAEMYGHSPVVAAMKARMHNQEDAPDLKPVR